jgi:transposase
VPRAALSRFVRSDREAGHTRDARISREAAARVSFDTLTAAELCAEVGDFRRFAKPALLSGLLGVVPSEYTSDSKRVQGQTTKAGPMHARRLLVEAAHWARAHAALRRRHLPSRQRRRPVRDWPSTQAAQARQHRPSARRDQFGEACPA